MTEITYLEAIREALFEEMARDEHVFCMGEDIGAFGGAFKVTEGLLAKFGESRVIDSPISEIALVGAAAGAAHMGMRPVVEMQFIDFIANAYDMLTNYVATARYRAFLPCPMVVRGPSGGYVRGGPFHSQNPEAGFLHTPGLKIVYPSTATDAKGLMKAAIRDDDCVLFFEHKYLYRRVKDVMPNGDHVVPIGKARVAREGSDVSIVTYAATVWKALEAAEASSQSALEANKLGYQVGVRINIDVLNSQSQLYSTKASLAKARYDVLLGGLKLRQAAGTLNAADLAAVSGQLTQ
jgi:2-oxoisovalerate dehydrogenase E1 component beta subunit